MARSARQKNGVTKVHVGGALSQVFGAAGDDPGLAVASVVGDGDAETGPSRRTPALQRPRVRA
jgi:hypothetical protein